MVLSIPQLQNLTLHLMVEKIEEGRSRARVLELPDCVVEAPSSEEAIEQLKQLVKERIAQTEFVSMDVEISHHIQAKNAWEKYAGIFKDDPYFAKVMEQMNAERQGEE